MVYIKISMNIVLRCYGYTTIMKLGFFLLLKKDFCKSLFSSLLYGWFVNFLPFSFLVWSGILCAVHCASPCAEMRRSEKQIYFWIICQSWIQRLMSMVCVLYIIYQALRSFLSKFPLSSLSVCLSVSVCVCLYAFQMIWVCAGF